MDPFEVLDNKVVHMIEIITKSWAGRDFRDGDIRHPIMGFWPILQDRINKENNDDEKVNDAKDSGCPSKSANEEMKEICDEKIHISLLWRGDCTSHVDGMRSRETCARCENMERCYYCGYGGPLYFLLCFRTNNVKMFGVLKGAKGCESYDGNEYDRTLWLSDNVHAVMKNVPTAMRLELEVASNLRVDAIIIALAPTLSHLLPLIHTEIVTFLNLL